jgi:hypothetical protein
MSPAKLRRKRRAYDRLVARWREVAAWRDRLLRNKPKSAYDEGCIDYYVQLALKLEEEVRYLERLNGWPAILLNG